MKKVTAYILAIIMLSMLYSISLPGLAAGDSWAEKADMPTGRNSLSTSVVNGRIYAIGGWDGMIPFSPSPVEEYDTGFAGQGVKVAGKLSTTWGEVKVGH